MTGGPWTLSMKVVHGAGPKWGSMFCPHPFHGFMLTDNALLNLLYTCVNNPCIS